jgi:hypothetical protein
MLVLADRAFDSNDFLAATARTGAQFLVRIRSSRRPPVSVQLPDGSYLTRIAGLQLRVIDADITLTTTDGHHTQGHYRLLTTLLDHRSDPAGKLIRLYHERWEIESAFYSLRHTLLTGSVLRSGDPAGLEQEIWALLTLYQALRIAMVAAVESQPGTDPDRASFTTALESARDLLVTARGVLPAERIDLTGDIGRAVLAGLLPPRRPRISVRKVKSPISRFHSRVTDNRPLTSQNITEFTVVIHPPDVALPSAPRRRRSWSRAPLPPAPTQPQPAASEGRQHRVLALLGENADRVWRGRELAHELGLTNLNSFRVQLSQWAGGGLINKVGRARYTLASPTLNTPLTRANTP